MVVRDPASKGSGCRRLEVVVILEGYFVSYLCVNFDVAGLKNMWERTRKRKRVLEVQDVDVDVLEGAHDKEGTRVDVSAFNWSANDWLAPEGTRILPADQSEADTSSLVSHYHVP
ncbi:hypothetical protein Tco_0194328 [Tanacetum coccineum]